MAVRGQFFDFRGKVFQRLPVRFYRSESRQTILIFNSRYQTADLRHYPHIALRFFQVVSRRIPDISGSFKTAGRCRSGKGDAEVVILHKIHLKKDWGQPHKGTVPDRMLCLTILFHVPIYPQRNAGSVTGCQVLRHFSDHNPRGSARTIRRLIYPPSRDSSSQVISTSAFSRSSPAMDAKSLDATL